MSASFDSGWTREEPGSLTINNSSNSLTRGQISEQIKYPYPVGWYTYHSAGRASYSASIQDEFNMIHYLSNTITQVTPFLDGTPEKAAWWAS